MTACKKRCSHSFPCLSFPLISFICTQIQNPTLYFDPSLSSTFLFSSACIAAISVRVVLYLAATWFIGLSGDAKNSAYNLSSRRLYANPSRCNSFSRSTLFCRQTLYAFALRRSGCLSISAILDPDSVRPSASMASSMPVALSAARLPLPPSSWPKAASIPLVFLTAVLAFLGAERPGVLFSSSASAASRSAFLRAASAFFASVFSLL